MTGDQRRAGWTVAGDDGRCIGSGQLVAFALPAPAGSGPFAAAWDICPECGRRVQIVTRDALHVLADHEAPEAPIPSRRDQPAGPSFGL